MATEAQVRANRLNAQRSTGPRTPEGKAQASQNAVTHGLLAREGVIRGESREEYEIHREMLMDELRPNGMLEVILATRVVDLTWRLHRAGQDRNEAFGALYDRYVAREGSAGAGTLNGAGGDAHPTGEAAGVWTSDWEPEAGSDGGEGVWASEHGRDARETQGQDALATGGQNLPGASRGEAWDTGGQEVCDTGTAAGRGAMLGRMVLEDFEQEAVLDRLLRYERRIEGSLYRTLKELRRIHEQNRPSDREVTDTLQRWREEDEAARKARMFAFHSPVDGPPRPASGAMTTARTEFPPASEIPPSPFPDPLTDSPRQIAICETNPIAAIGTPQARSGTEDERCETNPIAPIGTPPAGPGTPERTHVPQDSAVESPQHSHRAPAPPDGPGSRTGPAGSQGLGGSVTRGLAMAPFPGVGPSPRPTGHDAATHQECTQF